MPQTERISRRDLYDKMCMLMTNYEQYKDDRKTTIEEFYIFLVGLQGCWEAFVGDADMLDFIIYEEGR